MTDVNDRPPGLEDICAGLLNGAMVTLLGGALPAIIAWQVVAQFSGWLSDLSALTADLPATAFNALPPDEQRAVVQDSLTALPLILASFWAIRWGVGHIRENLALLCARRG